MRSDTFYFLRQNPVDLLRYLPKFLAKDDSFKNLQDTLSDEHENYRLKLIDTAKQFFLETATWGLEDWERFLGITPKPEQSFELRKAVCRVKLRGLDTMTVENTIRLMEEFMTTGHADIKELGNNQIQLVLDNGVFYWEELFEALWEFLPAHLSWDLNFQQHRELEIQPANITQIANKDTVEYAIIPKQKEVINLASVVEDATKEIIDYDCDFRRNRLDISVGNYLGIGGTEIIDAEEVEDKDFDPYIFELLYRQWKKWNKNPLVRIYAHHFPIDDSDEPDPDPDEEFYSGDILKMYFKHSDNHTRIVSLPHPKKNITGKELNTLALWIIENKVLLNSRANPATELVRATYLTKTVDNILGNNTRKFKNKRGNNG